MSLPEAPGPSSPASSGPTWGGSKDSKDGRKVQLKAGSVARPPVRGVGPNAAGQVGPELSGKSTMDLRDKYRPMYERAKQEGER